MIPTNARPFDKDNRPLKGEWVVVEDAPDQGTEVMPTVGASVDTSTTHGIDAISRTRSTAKPFPIWVLVIAVLLLGGLAFALLNRGGAGKASTPTVGTGSASAKGDGSTAELPPDASAPTIQLVAQNHKDNSLRYTFEIDLKTEGATLDTKNPITLSVEGGKFVGLEREGNLYTIAITRTGKGSLELLRLKYAPGPQNPALPRGKKRVEWEAPAPPPVPPVVSKGPTKPPKQPPAKNPDKKPPAKKPNGGGVINKADQ